jgi:acetyltransferase-like isoleucine patch superfamily enzyme
VITYGANTYGKLIPRGVSNNVIVGNYCAIADGVVVDCGFGHKTDVISTWPFDVFWHGKMPPLSNTGTFKGDVHIGNDVWIGEQAYIMSGVTIGDGAVIGLRSVVTHNVPPYAIVAGSPATVRKFRFTESIRDRLLKIKWWDWPEEKIRRWSHLLVSPAVGASLPLLETAQ